LGRQGWVEIVRKHIERDPLAVHQRGWIGDTPLHWPSHNNHAEIVTMLLDAGAVVEADEINCLMLTVMPVLFAIPDADACSLKALSQTNKMANS
jgi:ankyrin repeat protein